MLSGITNFLFGTAEETESQPQAQEQPLEPRIKTRYAENCDWVIVEKSSQEGIHVHGTNSGTDLMCHTHSHLNSSPTQSPGDSSDSSSDVSTLPDVACSGESWLVTPPPCFTAGGCSPTMETNPMENLLIEHPSMSVYGNRGRPSSTGVESDVSESSNDAEMASNLITTQQAKLRRSPRRPRAVAARAGLIAQVQVVKAAQTATQRKDRRQMSQKCLNRSNKVREVRSCKKHQYRRDFVLQPSSRSSKRC